MKETDAGPKKEIETEVEIPKCKFHGHTTNFNAYARIIDVVKYNSHQKKEYNTIQKFSTRSGYRHLYMRPVKQVQLPILMGLSRKLAA